MQCLPRALLRRYSGQAVQSTTHCHPVPRLRTRGYVPPLSHTGSGLWAVQPAEQNWLQLCAVLRASSMLFLFPPVLLACSNPAAAHRTVPSDSSSHSSHCLIPSAKFVPKFWHLIIFCEKFMEKRSGEQKMYDGVLECPDSLGRTEEVRGSLEMNQQTCSMPMATWAWVRTAPSSLSVTPPLGTQLHYRLMFRSSVWSTVSNVGNGTRSAGVDHLQTAAEQTVGRWSVQNVRPSNIPSEHHAALNCACRKISAQTPVSVSHIRSAAVRTLSRSLTAVLHISTLTHRSCRISDVHLY